MFVLTGNVAGQKVEARWDDGDVDPPWLASVLEDVEGANDAFSALEQLFDDPPEFSGDPLEDWDGLSLSDEPGDRERLSGGSVDPSPFRGRSKSLQLKSMVFTVGDAEIYEPLFSRPSTPEKLSGGSVWRTRREAQQYLDSHGLHDFRVYGVEADWETQTTTAEEGATWRSLTTDAPIVSLSNKHIEVVGGEEHLIHDNPDPSPLSMQGQEVNPTGHRLGMFTVGKSLTPPRLKESYFATCKRDDEGQCLPKGESEGGSAEENPTNEEEAEEDYKKNGVRSKAFKSWFGDWQNDPATASKVVNKKTGEPQENYDITEPVAVYHGTASGEYESFDPEKINQQSLYGGGLYFTEDREIAETYKEKDKTGKDSEGHVFSVFLNIRKPFDLDKDKISARQLGLKGSPRSQEALNKIIEIQNRERPQLTQEQKDEYEQRVRDAGPPPKPPHEGGSPKEYAAWSNKIGPKPEPAGLQEHRRRNGEEIKEIEEKDMDFPFSFEDFREWGDETGSLGEVDPEDPFEEKYISVADDINKRLRKLGYDGMTHVGGKNIGKKDHKVWIAFEPTQAKAVKNRGTFDPEDANIKKSIKSLKLPRIEKGGFTGQRRDSIGRDRCYEEGKQVPCHPDEGGSTDGGSSGSDKPKRPRKNAFGDHLPAFDPYETPKVFYKRGDEEVRKFMTKMPAALLDPEDGPAWGPEGMGWPGTRLSGEKLIREFGEEGLRKLMDMGWVSESRVGDESRYTLTRTAKAARIAQIRGIESLRFPENRFNVREIIMLLRDGVVTRETLMEHFKLDADTVAGWGVPHEEGFYDNVRKTFDEMLYRRYNPVPVWKRIARNKKVQAKVEALAGVRERAMKLYGDDAPVSREIKDLEKQMDAVFRQIGSLQEQMDSPEEFEGDQDYDKRKERHLALEAKINELAQRIDSEFGVRLAKLHDERIQLKGQMREHLVNEMLKVKDASPIAAGEWEGGHTDEEKEAVGTAARWLTTKVKRGPGGEVVPPYKVIRDERPITGRPGPSAYYRSSSHEINVHSGMTSVSTNVHEMGHGIEYKIPGVQTAAQRFLRYRVKDEPLVKLKDVFPASGYGDWEYGRRDEFTKAFGDGGWYAGKKENGQATEIVSMGLEKLYDNPDGFAKDDPEYCAFIVGVLDGSIRDNPVPE